jgi:uracil-DNA glycosylase family 4
VNPSSEAGRRVLLNRLYARYDKDPAFAHMREAGSRLVKGDGPTFPPLVFLGEAPGQREDKLGRPFLGASGKFLDELFASVGLKREEVFVTNAVKYRPVNESRQNRSPTDAEVHASLPYFRREHRILGHPPVVALGKHARKQVESGYPLPYGLTVGEWFWMGAETSQGGFPLLPLYHPAYGIYQRANRPLMFEQFKAVLDPPKGPF